MNRNEFKPVAKYLLDLKDQKNDPKFVSYNKGKDFFAIVPLYLEKFPYLYIRDNIDIDGTFAFIFDNNIVWTFKEVVDFYESLQVMLGQSTYTSVRNTGFIDYEADDGREQATGMWFQLK